VDEFYILSLKWTRSESCVWWRPENNGYTIFLIAAGRYSKETVLSNPGYYNNGTDTRAIPCDVVEQYVKRVLPSNSEFRAAWAELALPVTTTEVKP
jgi:hypothetical protein